MERDKELYRQREQYRHASCDTDTGAVCANCGAAVAADARFCEECGAPLGGHACRWCGASVAPGLALCPACGRPATMQCTYCGAAMGAGDAFCAECGNPRAGITCPGCGTLNFRSFCRKCNHPLNAMALQAVGQAKADPRYRRACLLADEMADMEEEMARLERMVADTAAESLLDTGGGMSDDTRRLLDEYERLSRIAPDRRRPAAAPTPAPEPRKARAFVIGKAEERADVDTAGRATFADAAAKLESLRRQYRDKAAELQREIDAMIPDPADPPEIQRNYACAHKITTRVTVYTKEKRRVAWVCNKCHIWHTNPSECAVAEFGGKWVSKEVTVESEATGTATINI